MEPRHNINDLMSAIRFKLTLTTINNTSKEKTSIEELEVTAKELSKGLAAIGMSVTDISGLIYDTLKEDTDAVKLINTNHMYNKEIKIELLSP